MPTETEVKDAKPAVEKPAVPAAQPEAASVPAPLDGRSEFDRARAEDWAKWEEDEDKKKAGEQKPEKKEEQKKAETAGPEEPRLSEDDTRLLKAYGIEGAEAAVYAKSPKLLAALKSERGKAANWENEARRWGSQNKTLAAELKKVKQAAEDSGVGRLAVRDAMKKAIADKIEMMPEGARRLAQDDDLVETMLTMFEAAEEVRRPSEKKETIDADAAPQDATASNTTSPAPAIDENLMREADAADKAVKEAGFPDYEATYRSPEFTAFMGERVTREIELAERVRPGLLDKINAIPDQIQRIRALREFSPSLQMQLSTNPAGHIRLLGEYKAFAAEQAALKQSETQNTKTKADLAGHGRSGGTPPAEEKGYKNPIEMTDSEFKEYERRMLSGG
jgi:hypothetical protein